MKLLLFLKLPTKENRGKEMRIKILERTYTIFEYNYHQLLSGRSHGNFERTNEKKITKSSHCV